MSAANRIAARHGQPEIDAVRCAHRILLSWIAAGAPVEVLWRAGLDERK